MEPPAGEMNAAMPRAIQKIVAKKGPNVLEDVWLAGRMQAVASVVSPKPGAVETAGVAPNVSGALDHFH